MFGFRLVSKKEYDKLVAENKSLSTLYKDLSTEKMNLEIENHALQIDLEEAAKINEGKAMEKGCLIGPWCYDCEHKRIVGGRKFSVEISGVFHEKYSYKRIYCAKHIHSACPEWKLKGE